MFKTTGVMICAVLLLQGCSGTSVKQQKHANVTSMPSGATVYANGQKLGVTPLQHDLYDAFPAGWKNWEYQAAGVLEVKMDGCEDYTLKVSDYILSKPIHAKLECSDAIAAEKRAPAMPVQSMPAHQMPAAPAADKSTTIAIEKRLHKLKQLRDKGVISEQEYQQNRKRILSEL